MIPRLLEPEVMETAQEAADYDSMDHAAVNQLFVVDFLEVANAVPLLLQAEPLTVLDVGTGTARIPIELCRRSSKWSVVAIDLAAEMLTLADKNLQAEQLTERIRLEQVDSKRLPYSDGHFDAVMSNSILHHIPKPQRALSEMFRVLKPGGLLFVRDLLRPEDMETVENIVQRYAADENESQQKLFRDSLHAALTIEEMQAFLVQLNIPLNCVRQTTDRHWTLAVINSGD